MRAIFSLKNVDDMEATMTVTMKVGEWKQLKEQIASMPYPSWKFGSMITDIIIHATTHFSGDGTSEDT